MGRRTRVAIIGGGPAGLSAAYHLTSVPGWQDHLEVTVHQLGWRLGGKGATGRDPSAGWRVQEHGIHGFCGFYDTTFRMMRDCYEQVRGPDGTRAGALPGTMEDAFRGMTQAALTELLDGRWTTTPQVLPWRDGVPWVDPPRLEPREALVGILEAMVRRHRPHGTDDHHDIADHHRHLLPSFLHHHDDHDPVRLLDHHAALARLHDHARDHGVTEWLLDEVLSLVADLGRVVTAVVRHLDLRAPSRLRIPLLTLDLLGALLRGLLTPDPDDGTRLIDRDLDEIDHLDHRTWLRQQGAAEATVTSVLADATANILFAYPGGDTTRAPRLSAGTWVGWFLRCYCIVGATYYVFPVGTGDGVIRPLYLALRERGVRFAFFSRLREVVLDDAGTAVTTLRMERQATVSAGPYAYDPLVRMPDRDATVWPDQPDWSQLDDGDHLHAQLARQGTDLESWWCRPDTAVDHELRVGEDVDVVVWAVPPATLPYVGRQLLDRHDRWARLHADVTTTATLGLQVWLDVPAAAMGGDGVEVVACDYVSSSYPAPLVGVAEFSDVLQHEAWPDPAPRSLLYACGPLADLSDPAALDLDDVTVPGRERARVAATAVQWLRGLAGLLPGLAAPPGEGMDPWGIDLTLLHATGDPVTAEARVAAQWVKANLDPPERYTQAPQGSAASRFAAWDTGVDNLVAAGDWIRTGIDAGSFEGAVLGGALAAHALVGRPTLAELPGYTFGHPWLARDGSPPARLPEVAG